MRKLITILGVSVVFSWLLGWSTSHAQSRTWSLAVIGDQQFPVNAEDSNDWLEQFTSQTQWIADNAAAKNLRMVVHDFDGRFAAVPEPSAAQNCASGLASLGVFSLVKRLFPHHSFLGVVWRNKR